MLCVTALFTGAAQVPHQNDPGAGVSAPCVPPLLCRRPAAAPFLAPPVLLQPKIGTSPPLSFFFFDTFFFFFLKKKLWNFFDPE